MRVLRRGDIHCAPPISWQHLSCQALPLPRGAIAFAASFIWLPNVLSGLGGAFSCFGFLISRLLRLCPLAMAECPFDKICAFARSRHVDRLETVMRGHPLMTFVVADAVLRRSAPGGNVPETGSISPGKAGLQKAAVQADEPAIDGRRYASSDEACGEGCQSYIRGSVLGLVPGSNKASVRRIGACALAVEKSVVNWRAVVSDTAKAKSAKSTNFRYAPQFEL